MPDTSTSPTRSAFLDLKDERQLVEEGFEFLDEKRMILAQEMLKRLRDYEAALDRHRELHDAASAALATAVGRHGLDGLEIYPAGRRDDARHSLYHSRFLGVDLVDGTFEPGERPQLPEVVNPSPEARRCREAFEALLVAAVEIAVMRASLIRLVKEYVRTERRARALENVILPEIEENLSFMEEQLEAMDQEEAVRVRNAAR
ncbi:MAG: V-type ATP synthase subunit D [Gammaproteobacteria bacterium]